MRLKTSFFDKTIFRKNLTRFFPIVLLYTLCLILGMTMMYMDGRDYGNEINFWFAHYMAQCINIMGVVNLFFAPLVAMLLFGDLFNSRMCNSLHAMPLRRETWFGTNILSGLTFSLVPTAVMALLSIPLLMGTVVHNAWQIGILWYIATNLQFICFFGMAVFSVMCTGNRLSMALVYAALNGGAFIIYYLVDMVLAPMLYGVQTADQLVELLTPIANMVEGNFVEVERFRDLEKRFYYNMEDMVANFWVNECYYDFIVLALVGMVFLLLALVLYRKRALECAGDAVAFPVLGPVFQTAFAIAASALGVMLLSMFFGYRFHSGGMKYVFLTVGLVVGWFSAKMFLERSTRVFGLKNWRGLGVLAAVALVVIGLTKFDVFGIESWVPKAEKVRSVHLYAAGSTIDLTEEEDIRQAIRIHNEALETRIENSGAFPLSWLQSRGEGVEGVAMPSGDGFYYGEGGYKLTEPHRYAVNVHITYTMNSGREAVRNYFIWTDGEAGDIVREYMSRWDVVWEDARLGWYDEWDISELSRIQISGTKVPDELVTVEKAQELLDAIKADCEERTMTQHNYFHTDSHFAKYDEEVQRDITNPYIHVSIYTGTELYETAADFEIYTDSVHSVQWLKDNGLLNWEIREGQSGIY